METSEVFNAIFQDVRELFRRYEKDMIVQHDEPGMYYLITRTILKNKQPLWFGGVEIKKNYVSCHLFPVYANPKLLEEITPELRQRMQGKACFNFKKLQPELQAQFGALMDRGVQDYRERQLLSAERANSTLT